MIRELTVKIIGREIFISSPKNQKNYPVKDMALLCEGLCTMIHSLHRINFKKDSDSLRDCIKHLENGFADETYKTIWPRKK